MLCYIVSILGCLVLVNNLFVFTYAPSSLWPETCGVTVVTFWCTCNVKLILCNHCAGVQVCADVYVHECVCAHVFVRAHACMRVPTLLSLRGEETFLFAWCAVGGNMCSVVHNTQTSSLALKLSQNRMNN